MNNDKIQKFKIFIDKIINFYDYSLIVLSFLLILIGGHFIFYEITDDNDDYGLLLLVFLYLLLTFFIVLPVTCYRLFKKNFIFFRKQFLIITILCFSLYIGPYVRYNTYSYRTAINKIEKYINKGEWDDAYSYYNIIYIRNKRIGIPYVRRCQEKLKLAGFYSGKINGMLSGELPKSISLFQSSMNLMEDGKIGEITNTFLVAYIVPKKLNLKKEDIQLINHQMIFDSVRNFQKKHNLSVDGRIGPDTENLLLSHLNFEK